MAESLNVLRVLGVLAGQDLSTHRIAEWARSADVVLAADGGADSLFEQGIMPDLTIGDLDSLQNRTPLKSMNILFNADQNSSDCDKLLAHAEASGYEAITLCAIEGDQLDHVLGTLYSGARSRLKVRLALRRGVGQIVRGPIETTIDLPEGTRLSVMPVTSCEDVDLAGVEWPLTSAVLDPLGLTSLSNRAFGPITVRLRKGVAILFASHPLLERPHW